MYKLLVTELAHRDLDQITSYIAVQLNNPTAAAHFLSQVAHCYGNLKHTPAMFEECRNRRLAKEHYRKALIMNYVLIYRIDEAAEAVIVYRFFYGRQDYDKLL